VHRIVNHVAFLSADIDRNRPIPAVSEYSFQLLSFGHLSFAFARDLNSLKYFRTTTQPNTNQQVTPLPLMKLYIGFERPLRFSI
jgi:hypothetical protein